MPVSEQTYLQLALEDVEGHWELHCGNLRQKPGMTAEHNDLMMELGLQLRQRLDRIQFRVRINAGRVRHSAGFYIPDVFVIPAELERTQRGTRQLEFYNDPLPLVAEVWSPSTGTYDVETKLRQYQERGDREIWRLHPDRTLTAWRRQADGSYSETIYTGGVVPVVSLPGVTIDLDELYD